MNFYDWSTIWLSHVELVIRSLDWLVLFGFFLIAAASYVFLKMARNRASTFDFAEMFEGTNGRTSMAKFLGFVAGLTGTWAIVALTAAQDLTEGYFGLYLGILVAGKVASEYVATKQTTAENGNGASADEPRGELALNVSVPVKNDQVRVTTPRRPLGKFGKE